MYNTGWICPKCGGAIAPWIQCCPYCEQSHYITTNTVEIGDPPDWFNQQTTASSFNIRYTPDGTIYVENEDFADFLNKGDNNE